MAKKCGKYKPVYQMERSTDTYQAFPVLVSLFTISAVLLLGMRLIFVTTNTIAPSLVLNNKNTVKFSAADLMPSSESTVNVGTTPPRNSLALLPISAWDYFKPSWIKESLWEKAALTLGDLDEAVENNRLANTYLDDPDDKISDEFNVPERLRSRVKFWFEVYSRFNSKIHVIHDRREPGIVYGYIDYRPLFRAFSPVVAEIKAEAIEKQVLKDLRARLLEAAGVTTTSFLSNSGRESLRDLLLQLNVTNKGSLNALIENIRTQTGQSDLYLSALHRSKNLLPHIESVLKQYDMPIALARIPFVESSFNIRALSKIGALGIWQFMPTTAKEYIHENKEALWGDPIAQTKAAARLLLKYRSVSADWGCAITAYNSGIGKIMRLQKKYDVKGIEDLVALKKRDGLGFAGKNFYSEFLAANLVEAYKEDLFGSLLMDTRPEIVFTGTVSLPKNQCGM